MQNIALCKHRPLPTAPQLEERDTVIGNVYRKLMEIESRLLPCGLHVVGVSVSCSAQCVAILPWQ